MQTETLIKMANQIGDFYESFPDVKQAQIDIAGHLNRYWALQMRQQLALHVKDAKGEGLHAKVILAIASHVKV